MVFNSKNSKLKSKKKVFVLVFRKTLGTIVLPDGYQLHKFPKNSVLIEIQRTLSHIFLQNQRKILSKILKMGEMSVTKLLKLGENRANLRESFNQIGRNFSQNFLILGGYPPPPGRATTEEK
jgi:hypothetical protein